MGFEPRFGFERNPSRQQVPVHLHGALSDGSWTNIGRKDRQ